MHALVEDLRRRVGWVSLEQSLDHWLRTRRDLSRDYQQQCGFVAGLLRDAVDGDISARELSTEHCQRVIRLAQDRGCSPAAQRTYRRVISAYASWAVDEGYMRRNPARRVTAPRGAAKRRRILPWERAREFVRAVKPGFRGPILAALLAGLRRREIVRLRWDDVGADRVIVTGAKTGLIREVPLHRRLRAELDDTPRISRWVWPRQDGRPRGNNTRVYADAVSEALDAVGLPRATTDHHGLRKTFSSRLGTLGWGEALIGELLGHQVASVTQLYLVVEWEQKMQAVDSLRIDYPVIGPAKVMV